MNHVEINVVELKLLEGFSACRFDVFDLVDPDFGGDEQVLSFQGFVDVEDVVDDAADHVLVAVEAGTIDQSIPILNYCNLQRFRIVHHERAHTELRHLFTVVQCNIVLLAFNHTLTADTS